MSDKVLEEIYNKIVNETNELNGLKKKSKLITNASAIIIFCIFMYFVFIKPLIIEKDNLTFNYDNYIKIAGIIFVIVSCLFIISVIFNNRYTKRFNNIVYTNILNLIYDGGTYDYSNGLGKYEYSCTIYKDIISNTLYDRYNLLTLSNNIKMSNIRLSNTYKRSALPQLIMNGIALIKCLDKDLDFNMSFFYKKRPINKKLILLSKLKKVNLDSEYITNNYVFYTDNKEIFNKIFNKNVLSKLYELTIDHIFEFAINDNKLYLRLYEENNIRENIKDNLSKELLKKIYNRYITINELVNYLASIL